MNDELQALHDILVRLENDWQRTIAQQQNTPQQQLRTEFLSCLHVYYCIRFNIFL